MNRVVLAVELKRLVDGGAIHRRLHVFHDAEAILEPDNGALIETEEITGLFAETAAFQVAVEPVRQLKVGSVNGKPEGGRQIDDAIVRFRELERPIIAAGGGSSRGLAGGRGRRRISGTLRENGGRTDERQKQHAEGDGEGTGEGASKDMCGHGRADSKRRTSTRALKRHQTPH